MSATVNEWKISPRHGKLQVRDGKEPQVKGFQYLGVLLMRERKKKAGGAGGDEAMRFGLWC